MSQEGLKMTHVTVAGCQRSGNWRRFSLSSPLENMGVEMTAAAGLRFWTRATVTYLVFHLLHLHPLLQVQSVLKIIPKNKYQGAKNWPGENYNLIPQQKRATARWSGHWCSSSSSSSSPLSSSSAGSGRRHRSYHLVFHICMTDQEDTGHINLVFHIYEWSGRPQVISFSLPHMNDQEDHRRIRKIRWRPGHQSHHDQGSPARCVLIHKSSTILTQPRIPDVDRMKM